MDRESLQSLMPELEGFLSRYASRFGRQGHHVHARSLVRGLLAGGDRRNVENMAEAIEGGVVRTLQKFLGQGAWKDQEVLTELRRHVVEELGEDEAVLIVEEPASRKKGKKSAGVARQYSGTLGRINNCQVGVFVSYHSSQGHTLIDRRLFLPEEWPSAAERCQEAGFPDSVIFRSKPELATEMIQQAILEGVPFYWITGDSIYGNTVLSFCKPCESLRNGMSWRFPPKRGLGPKSPPCVLWGEAREGAPRPTPNPSPNRNSSRTWSRTFGIRPGNV